MTADHSVQQTRRIARRPYAVLLALVAALSAGLSSCSGTSDEAPASLGVLGSALHLSAPSTLEGYGGCTFPACAELARACTDIVALGCGEPFTQRRFRQEDGTYEEVQSMCDPSDTSGCDGDQGAPHRECAENGFLFDALVENCVIASSVTINEELAEVREESEERLGSPTFPFSDTQLQSFYALQMANCVRRSTNCQQRIDCTRRTFISSSPVTTLPFPDDWKTPPSRPAFYEKEWQGDGERWPWANPPWDGEEVHSIPGVDSPSCVRCAMQRCPTFAFRCFGADGDTAECPEGDCCDSLRQCVRECGGYAEGATSARFVLCMDECAQDRPHAPQQLADLQHCAETTCKDCEKFDEAKLGTLPEATP